MTCIRHRSAALFVVLLVSCGRSAAHSDSTAAVDSLKMALESFGAVLNRVGHVAELGPDSNARRLATDSVLVDLARVDTMMAPASDEPADSHVMVARHEAREAIGLLRTFLAGGADTTTGSPGRDALEIIEQHLRSASNELDQVGGYH